MRVRPSVSFTALCCFIAVSFWATTLPGDQGDQSRVPAIAALGEKELAAIRIVLRSRRLQAGSRRKIVRVTAKPFHVAATEMVWVLCTSDPAAGTSQPPQAQNPHEGWIHVYVTRQGEEVIRTGKGVYPPGTIILKQKLSDAAGKKAEFFTGMVKRAKGYDPEAGDWEFFVMNAEATIARPPLNVQSCVDCHAPFRTGLCLRKRYLTAKVADGRESPRLPAMRADRAGSLVTACFAGVRSESLQLFLRSARKV